MLRVLAVGVADEARCPCGAAEAPCVCAEPAPLDAPARGWGCEALCHPFPEFDDQFPLESFLYTVSPLVA